MSALLSTVRSCSLRERACRRRSAKRWVGRQRDDHRRRVARAAGFVMHEEMMHPGRVSPADCCSGWPSMLRRSAGDAGAGRGRRPFPTVRRWGGFRTGTCSPPPLAVSSLTDSQLVFQPITYEMSVILRSFMRYTLNKLFTSRSSAVCLLLTW